MVDDEAVLELLKRALRAWETGRPTARIYAEVQRATAHAQCGGQLPEMSWFSECMQDGDARAPFDQVLTALYRSRERIGAMQNKPVGVEAVLLQMVLFFVSVKSLQSADTPIWFSLSEALALQLLTTEIRGVFADDVKMPYPSINIELPPGLLYLHHGYTKDHEVRRVAIAEGVASGDREELTLSNGVAHGHLAPTPAGRTLLVLAQGEPNANSTSPDDDCVSWFICPLEGGDTVDESLTANRPVSEQEVAGRFGNVEVAGRFGNVEMNFTDLFDLLSRFVVNTLLYINSKDADVEHKNAAAITKLEKKIAGKKKPRKTELSRLTRMRATTEWLVGSHIVLDPNLKRAVEEGEGAYTGRSLLYKHTVRGHWRNQAHGPGRSLRRLRWIAPHVRGGHLDGPALGHNYEVR